MKLAIYVFAYAGIDARTVNALIHEQAILRERKVHYTLEFVTGDALISRSRSKAMSDFLRSDADVFFMVDRDIEWVPGDLLALADVALLKKAAVAGFYATRAKGLGYSGRLKEERARVTIGADVLHEAEFLPGGFTAIHRSVAVAVTLRGSLPWCVYFDGSTFMPFFLPLVVPSSLLGGKFEYLSEDWAFSARAAKAGCKLYLWSKPVLAHWGEHPFTMSESVQASSPTGKIT